MNKKFLQKNIFMIVFMSLALVAVIALLIMVFVQHESMKKYDTRKGELLEKINKIFKQKYAPVKVNVVRIKSDVVGYEKETRKLEKQFGHPYALALKSFVKVIEIPLDQFKAKFGEFWEAQKGKTTRDLIFLRYKVRQFSEDFPKHRSEWDKAMEDFMREAQKVTLEKIDISNVDGIFLAVMGKGRRFSDSPGKCLTFMKHMRNKMLEYFDDKKVGCEAANNFSFKHEQEPLGGDIEKIARAWEIVSDLTRRIADAKVNQEKDVLRLVKFSKRGLDGEKDGNYILYRFNFTVNGDLASIRRVVKNLYAAYKENRVYAIRDIKLSKMVDGVDDILAESERIKEESDYESMEEKNKDENQPSGIPAVRSDRRRFNSPTRPGTSKPKPSDKLKNAKIKSAAKEKKKILKPNDPGYAKIIIGRNNICRVEFEVDYIVFDDSPNN
ncbi:MAG: hypothetical protein KAS17_10175 [Victivallaceae bacterium]|nr:hypothetical protein [Victivallaceae bacterium]